MISFPAPQISFSVTFDTSSICELLLQHITDSNRQNAKTHENTFSIVNEETDQKLGSVCLKIAPQNVAKVEVDNAAAASTVESSKGDTHEQLNECGSEMSSDSIIGLVRQSFRSHQKPRESISASDVTPIGRNLKITRIQSQDVSANPPSCLKPLVQLVSSTTNPQENQNSSLVHLNNEYTNSAYLEQLDNSSNSATGNVNSTDSKESSPNNYDILNTFLADDQLHKCTKCSYETWSKKYLLQHHRNQHANLFVYCAYCGSSFRQKYLLRRHYVSKHNLSEDVSQGLVENVAYISTEETDEPVGKSPKTFHSDLAEFLHILKSDKPSSNVDSESDNASNEASTSRQVDCSDSILRNRLSGTNPSFSICQICNYTAVSQEKLGDHYRKVHKLAPNHIKAQIDKQAHTSSDWPIGSTGDSLGEESSSRLYRVPNLVLQMPHVDIASTSSNCNNQTVVEESRIKTECDFVDTIDEPEELISFMISKNP